MAVQAGVPIVPIVIANYSNLYSAKEKRFVPGTLRCRGKRVRHFPLDLNSLISFFKFYRLF